MNAQPHLPTGVFETFRLWNGQPIAWELHRERLLSGARLLGAEMPPSVLEAAFREIDYKWELLGKPEHTRVRLKVRCVPTVAVALEVSTLAYSLFENTGERLRVGLFSTHQLAEAPYCWHKTLQRTAYEAARSWAEAHGFDDALLLQEGHVADSTRSNVLILTPGGEVAAPSPDSRRLAGTALARVKQGLAKLGQTVQERPILQIELANVQGILLTNAIRGIEWVESLDGRQWPQSPAQHTWLQQLRIASFT